MVSHPPLIQSLVEFEHPEHELGQNRLVPIREQFDRCADVLPLAVGFPVHDFRIRCEAQRHHDGSAVNCPLAQIEDLPVLVAVFVTGNDLCERDPVLEVQVHDPCIRQNQPFRPHIGHR